MYKAKLGNRVLNISESQLEIYKALGYTISKESGELVYSPEKTKDEQIIALKKDLKSTKEELMMTKKALTTATKALEAVKKESSDKKTGDVK